MAKRFFIPIVAGLLPVLFSTGCLTLTRGTHQTVPAVSRPAGVRVIVDGKPAGTTPVNLELTRRNIHTIRFEMDGYRPVEITLKRKSYIFFAAVIGNIALMPAAYIVLGVPLNAIWADDTKEELGAIAPYLTGALLGWLGGIIIDGSLPSNRELEPHTLSITME